MKKNLKKLFLLMAVVITVMVCLSLSASCFFYSPSELASENDFFYVVEEDSAIVVAYTGEDTSLTIPSKLGGYPVVSVAFGNFYANNNRGEITAVTLPESVKAIGEGAFYEWYNLKTINLPSKIRNIGPDAFYGTAYFNNKSNWGKDGGLYIGKYLIAVDTSSSSFTVKSGTYTIAEDAFKYCEGSYDGNINDIATTAPIYTTAAPTTMASTTGGGTGSAEPENYNPGNNVELKTVKLPSSLKYIGAGAFGSCGSIKKVYAANAYSWFNIVFGNLYANPVYFAPKLYFDNKIARDIVVPEGIKSINDYALRNYKRVKSIKLSDTVASIGASAFDGCENLQSITITKSLKKIGNNAFYGCESLESVYADDVKSWINIDYETNFYMGSINTELTYSDSTLPMSYATELYFNNKLARNVVIPEGVKKIKSFAFFGCDSIESVTIPSSVTSIGDAAFVSCKNLKNVYASDVASWCKIKFGASGSPTLYAKNLYFGKTLAKTLTIPSTVKEIYYGAFNGLACLETVIIPKSVEDINFYAFNGCKNLKTICYAGTEDEWYEIEFKHKADVYYNGLKKPSAPSGLSASQTTSTVTLKWNKASGAKGYAVYQYNSKTKKYDKLTSTTETSYKISKLSAGTTYKFKVKAYAKKSGQTLWGDFSKELTTATKPATPSVTKLTTTTGKASLVWSDISGENGYELYYSTSSDSGFKKAASYKANVVKGSKSGLTSGKTYYFKVRAYKTAGDSKIYSSYSPVKSIKIK